MSVPRHIFIDTSIFDALAYNFTASTFTALEETASKVGLTLLMPDPTQREIRRHIAERTDAVIGHLKLARKAAGFLPSWAKWPLHKGDERTIKYELRRMAEDALDALLKKLNCEHLKYEGVKIEKIMDWYDNSTAPFGRGDKRKEFPDAFAFAAVAHYATSRRSTVAVISGDRDFAGACERHDDLFFFDTVGKYLEALLGEDKRLSDVRTILEAGKDTVADALAEAFKELGFYPEEDAGGDVEDVDVGEVNIGEPSIIGIGDHEISIAYAAEIFFTATVWYDDPDSIVCDSSEDVYFARDQIHGSVSNRTTVEGTAKLRVDDNWIKVESVDRLDIDESDICVEGRPEEGDWDD